MAAGLSAESPQHAGIPQPLAHALARALGPIGDVVAGAGGAEISTASAHEAPLGDLLPEIGRLGPVVDNLPDAIQIEPDLLGILGLPAELLHLVPGVLRRIGKEIAAAGDQGFARLRSSFGQVHFAKVEQLHVEAFPADRPRAG